MSYRPTISVIIPAYNAARTICHAMESALAQTYRPQEILVIDDGSQDDTARIVADYPAPVQLLQRPNGGPAAARNQGARQAQGEWLALLDADDHWLPHKLELQIVHASDPSVGLIHCFDEGNRRYRCPSKLTFDRLWDRNSISASSVLIRRAAFESVGGFNEDPALISIEDYNLWLRIAAAAWKIATVKEALWCYTPAPGNLSSDVERCALAELANVEAISKQFALSANQIARKRIAVYEAYGQDLFYYRQLPAARRWLSTPLKADPSLALFARWCATFLPVPLLDLYRQLHVSRKGHGDASHESHNTACGTYTPRDECRSGAPGHRNGGYDSGLEFSPHQHHKSRGRSPCRPRH